MKRAGLSPFQLEGAWYWWTVYRQLFLWIVTGNLTIVIVAAAGAFPWGHKHRVQFTAANILISVLARNEVFMRLLYMVLVKMVTIGTPHGLGTLWAPVWLRNLIANFLLHIGGIHSGCGTGGLIWLVYGAVFLILDRHSSTNWVIVLGYLLMTLVFLACVSAIPALRFKFHDAFEHVHRLTGWSSLVVMVAFIAFLYSGEQYQWRLFVATYWFWITLLTILLVALPWCCVSKVAVEPLIPASERLALLKFPGYVSPGLYGRISRSRLSEWHVFGCFGESSTQPHHFMICSAVGGFTKALVSDPPAYLYTRLIKFPGFSYCHRMYSSGVAICTGAAIGVFISLFSNRGLTNFSLIWVGSKFEATYGSEVVGMLRNGCPEGRLTLYDTSVSGRPDLVSLASEAYHSQGAEVVFCVSNLAGTRALVRGCHRQGIPAFGPVWDA